MRRRECGCLDRPGGCIHNWITIPMGGGFEEGGYEDDLSPEAEAEHFLVVERVAREHGFPLSDWRPKLSD